jgi:hypothetical protein
MTTIVAPNAALAPTPPAVGIFWLVSGILVVERSTLDEAEAYGDCITHSAGHYERWEEWQRLGAARLVAMGYPEIITTTEYEDWPRGRVVYETLARHFVIYADRRLQKPNVIGSLRTAFGLNQAEVIVRSDAHYR